ncbi:RAMP superfamily CRISPR-associated protein [Crocosphaera sp. XPORK-15E]|uniref:RAMP superfamily CRISPR-associated protein n=1 Tax=Crocosphaera sp. XPORK-15E TaxID=3110247 RepID=UPI002B1F1682|nr:RAMP superfamily CRISPR-associated protein [Crocosphaera sp. XPORK-15E]MEA5537025.1 RAMP superfamily CRISPR-associated protein [Crocosphaera sp. XPORK-15E]
MYTGTKLIELLEKQQQTRGQSDLFKKGTFVIQWRAKVGSYPHPDGETMISAGEPCGNWQHDNTKKLNVGDNCQRFPELPLNGYIPGSSIRGLVRAWAKKYPEIHQRMNELLGYQDDEKIVPGKIEFLDAYPQEPTPLTLDIVNPQQDFQVLHKGQSKPLSFYTLGDGKQKISVTIAIRGIVNKTTPTEVQEVWEWVEQSLCFYGVGSRTASGYGAIKSLSKPKLIWPSDESVKIFDFTLYSQGCYGANQRDRDDVELRPSHWRGWLRSWVWRFLLGVMSENNAKKTLGELLGNIDDENGTSNKGCVRLEVIKSTTWGKSSNHQPRFYTWKGKLKIIAPKDILNNLILPIIKFAVSVGGVGRGWRRPLHIFQINNRHNAARGCDLKLLHKARPKPIEEPRLISYILSPNKPENWSNTYQKLLDTFQDHWPNRITIGANPDLQAEVFSPTTCAIFAVAGPVDNPIDESEQTWDFIRSNSETRGEGMNLIYQDKYKRKTDVGGNAGQGNAHCSWVSIRRVKVPHKTENTNCQEIVCLFMGGKSSNPNHLRSQFLKDLSQRSGASLLFGYSPIN